MTLFGSQCGNSNNSMQSIGRMITTMDVVDHVPASSEIKQFHIDKSHVFWR